MSYPAVSGYTENEVYLDKLAITLSSHLEHPHHPVAVVVDDFNDDSAGFGFVEGAGGVAVECGPGFGVGLAEDDEEVAFATGRLAGLFIERDGS
jgi:hypothetical protein